MSGVTVLVACAAVVGLALILGFLLILYLRGGRDDMHAGAISLRVVLSSIFRDPRSEVADHEIPALQDVAPTSAMGTSPSAAAATPIQRMRMLGDPLVDPHADLGASPGSSSIPSSPGSTP